MKSRFGRGSWSFVLIAIVAQAAPAVAAVNLPPTAAFSSGCSGSGPGIITGRVPNYEPETGGVVRIVAGGTDGDAFVAEMQQENATKQWMMRKFSNPQNVSAYGKNPVPDPSEPDQFHGDTHDPNAVLAFIESRIATSRGALAAIGSAKMTAIGKDGSFVCRGVDSGKYHVIAQMNHIPASAVAGGPNATGMSQTTLQADVEIPRVKPGQKVLVQVSRFVMLESLKH